MAHTSQGRKLGRKQGARISLLRNLTTELLRHEKIQTTFPKAKECARLANRLLCLARQGDLNARRAVARDIHDQEVYFKLFDVLSQRYANRTPGFTQIFRLASRQGDNAPMAMVKLVA